MWMDRSGHVRPEFVEEQHFSHPPAGSPARDSGRGGWDTALVLGEIAIAVAATLLVGGALAFIARWVGLTVKRATATAAAAGALAAIVAIELVDADAADWLQKHAVAAAAATGACYSR